MVALAPPRLQKRRLLPSMCDVHSSARAASVPCSACRVRSVAAAAAALQHSVARASLCCFSVHMFRRQRCMPSCTARLALRLRLRSNSSSAQLRLECNNRTYKLHAAHTESRRECTGARLVLCCALRFVRSDVNGALVMMLYAVVSSGWPQIVPDCNNYDITWYVQARNKSTPRSCFAAIG
jgi:hypothetical protein